MLDQQSAKKLIVTVCVVLVLGTAAVVLVNIAKERGLFFQQEVAPVAAYTPEIRSEQTTTATITGEIVEVDLKRKTIRLSTNGKDSYTGIVTPDTQMLRGDRHIKLSEIRVGDVGTLFTLGMTNRTFEIEAVRIIENLRNINELPPPSASF